MDKDTSDRRDLSLYQVEILLKSTATQAQDKSRSVSSWLCRADTVQLLCAIDNDAEQVYLSNMARWFNIQYMDDKIWLSPVGSSFVPCGWFTIKALRRELAEEDVISVL